MIKLKSVFRMNYDKCHDAQSPIEIMIIVIFPHLIRR